MRGSDIDGLFKKRAIQGIGLVKNCQHLELTIGKQALDRDLKAWDKIFDQERGLMLGITLLHQETTQTLESNQEFLGCIGTYHTTAPRETLRLEHTGIGDLMGNVLGIIA